jgi:hypothetical protein
MPSVKDNKEEGEVLTESMKSKFLTIVTLVYSLSVIVLSFSLVILI